MIITIIILAVLVLLLAPFKMHTDKYFHVLSGVLIFSLVLVLTNTRLLDPITRFWNWILAVIILAIAEFIYYWYFKKVIARRGNNSSPAEAID